MIVDILLIIGGIVFSYLVFVFITFGLARLLFPKIEIEDDILNMEHVRRLKHNFSRKRRQYSHGLK